MSQVKISLIVDSFYQSNEIFNENNALVNRDDCMRPWIELRKSLLIDSILIDTVDICSIDDSNIVFFFNVPSDNDPYLKEAIKKEKRIYCAITELDLIHKENLNISKIETFDKVFTYQNNLVDNHKVFKLNYSFNFIQKSRDFKPIEFNLKRFSTIISGNKSLNHKNELYSERIKIIRWYERNFPDCLDLFGTGWNVLSIRSIKIKYSYFGVFGKMFSNYFKSYRGKISNKNDTLSSYKFSFCLENAFNVPGWITEKIFDSLFSGCVPIYFGEDNIAQFVDDGCFIDYRKYDNIEELHKYLFSISEEEYTIYINNIKKFLSRKASEDNYEFGIPYFIETIKNQIKQTK
jgi:hypothetical protein